MDTKLPSSLYKFCDLETAIKILDSGSLRWSSPNCFNDPYEMDNSTPFDITHDALIDALVKTAASMIFAKEEPKGTTPVINAVKRWRDEERFTSPEEAQEVLKGLAAQITEPHKEVLEKIGQDWLRFASGIRICSFSETLESNHAWRTFGDNHTGVALRFAVGDGTQHKKPMKMQYKTERPSISAMKDHVAAILYNTRVQPQDRFLELFLTKAPDYKNDKEWRSFTRAKVEDGNTSTFNDIPFETQELTGLYFGLNTPESSKRDLSKLFKNISTKGKCFQAEVSAQSYELTFNPADLT